MIKMLHSVDANQIANVMDSAETIRHNELGNK